MQKRFQATTILINRERLHTIIDRESGQYCAVTYKYEIDAILEADFLNSANAIIELRTAKEQRKGRANLPGRSSLDRSPEGVDCDANKYLA